MASSQHRRTSRLTVTPIPAPTNTATSELNTSSAGAPNGPSTLMIGMPFPRLGAISINSPLRPPLFSLVSESIDRQDSLFF
jgi:hypothetical protein